MNQYAIDLTCHHFCRLLGEYVIYGTWLLLGDEPEPCLVIVPAHRKADHRHIAPACIALSSAYKYDSPSYLLSKCMNFNAAMGFQDSMAQTYKLAKLIHDHLQDLIELPPMPMGDSRVVADAVVTDHATGKKFEGGITDV